MFSLSYRNSLHAALAAALSLGAITGAQAQTPFTFNDDASTGANVTFISNSVAPYQYGLYVAGATYLGDDMTQYGYYNNTGGAPPTAFGLYDAAAVPGGGTGAQFTSVTVTAIVNTADTLPAQSDIVILTSNTPIAYANYANPASQTGVVTVTPVVTGPVTNLTNSGDPFYNFTATFAPSEYVLFGVVQDGSLGFPPVYVGNVALAGVVPAAAPEPSQTAALGLGVLALTGLALKASKRRATAA